MQISLKNIGVIKKSTIALNGLTIITGKNNSGKTTVGKTLYSIVTAVDKLEESAINDKTAYAMGIMENVLTIIGLSRVLSRNRVSASSDLFPISHAIYSHGVSFSNVDEVISFTEDFRVELEALTKDKLYKLALRDAGINNFSELTLINIWNNIKQNKDATLDMLDKLKATLLQDLELTRYANSKIMSYLNGEFFSQIAPVRIKNDVESEVIVKSGAVKYYDIRIKNKELVNQEATYFVSCFDKCWFIDDVNAIDQMASFAHFNELYGSKSRYYARNNVEINYSGFINTIGRRTHQTYLLEGLTKSINEYEQSIHKEKAGKIFDLIASELNSKVVYADGQYICAEDKLNVHNLASGSKLLLILKLLLENGCFDTKSLIVLDEPENHLHPDWINKVAEAVVLIQKDLGATILVTTHSPNFLLAIETMTKKHQTTNALSVYVSEKLNDKYMVEFKDVTDNLEYAYSHLAQPYLTMDNLRYNFDDKSEG